MPLHLPIYNRQTDRQTDRKILANKRSQSALEYMMTYGWAILIIVIVAAVLYSFGIFSPSSSISATITGFSGLGSVAANCVYNEGLVISLGNSAGYLINVTSINITDTSISATTNAKIGSVISPSSNEIFLIPTACPAVGSRYSISAIVSYTEPGQTFPGPYVSTGTATGSVSNSNSPQQISYSEPLAIDPSSAQDPPSPFQQMINMTSSAPGWSHISSSPFGQNVEFTYPNGTVIPSWLENYTSSRAIWWVKLASYGSQTIFMDFVPISTNLFNTVNTGEAPQLSSTYGEYDNGANVFESYDNFAGTTLNTNKWSEQLPSGYTITQDNNINMSTGATQWWGGLISILSFTAPVVTEADVIGPSEYPGAAAGLAEQIGPVEYSLGYDVTYWNFGRGNMNGGMTAIAPAVATTGVIGLAWVATGDEYEYQNYSVLQHSTNSSISLTSKVYASFGSYCCDPNYITLQWVRVRAYPPSGIMPPVTFGSVS